MCTYMDMHIHTHISIMVHTWLDSIYLRTRDWKLHSSVITYDSVVNASAPTTGSCISNPSQFILVAKKWYSVGRLTVEHSMRVGDYTDWLRSLIFQERCTVVCVSIWPIPVHLARRGFQNCVVYCLLPATLVYSAVLQPGLLSVYCLIHYTTTSLPRTTFSELLQALCHQFIAKHTLMSFITGLGYFVSWGNCNDQTCFLLV